MRSNLLLVAAMCLLSIAGLASSAWAAGDRIQMLLSDSVWQYAGSATALPEIGTPEFDQQRWTDVRVPHVFQTREAMTTILRAWYKKDVSLPPEANSKHLYLVFEGAASIADVYVNGRHLGQHSFDNLPDAVRGASWIAQRRITKAGQESNLSSKVTQPATVYVMCTKTDSDPAFLSGAGFSEVKTDHLVWRDNALNLVPAQV